MSIYYNTTEVKEIDDAVYADWVATNNPKANSWTLRPPQPAFDSETQQANWVGNQWVVSAYIEECPISVPAHHLRRALRNAGMIAAVTTYMESLPENDLMSESWEYAPYFRRDAIGIETARVALGLTVEQVDDLFRAAGAIVT